jgi:hypothetical protein
MKYRVVLTLWKVFSFYNLPLQSWNDYCDHGQQNSFYYPLYLLYEDYGSQILQSIMDACFLSAVPVMTDLYLMGWVDSLSQQVLYIHHGLSVSVVECYVVDHELFFG